MAHFLFVDESGGQESPYEVLAVIAVEDRDLWNLVLALQEAEIRIFGRRYTTGERELKATKLLKTKTFHLAQLPLTISMEFRRHIGPARKGRAVEEKKAMLRFRAPKPPRTIITRKMEKSS